MGFLHLGWESATVDDDGSGKPLSELSPLWSVVGSVVDLKRPGLPTVQRVLGWHPLHVVSTVPVCACCFGAQVCVHSMHSMHAGGVPGAGVRLCRQLHRVQFAEGGVWQGCGGQGLPPGGRQPQHIV